MTSPNILINRFVSIILIVIFLAGNINAQCLEDQDECLALENNLIDDPSYINENLDTIRQYPKLLKEYFSEIDTSKYSGLTDAELNDNLDKIKDFSMIKPEADLDFENVDPKSRLSGLKKDHLVKGSALQKIGMDPEAFSQINKIELSSAIKEISEYDGALDLKHISPTATFDSETGRLTNGNSFLTLNELKNADPDDPVIISVKARSDGGFDILMERSADITILRSTIRPNDDGTYDIPFPGGNINVDLSGTDPDSPANLVVNNDGSLTLPRGAAITNRDHTVVAQEDNVRVASSTSGIAVTGQSEITSPQGRISVGSGGSYLHNFNTGASSGINAEAYFTEDYLDGNWDISGGEMRLFSNNGKPSFHVDLTTGVGTKGGGVRGTDANPQSTTLIHKDQISPHSRDFQAPQMSAEDIQQRIDSARQAVQAAPSAVGEVWINRAEDGTVNVYARGEVDVRFYDPETLEPTGDFSFSSKDPEGFVDLRNNDDQSNFIAKGQVHIGKGDDLVLKDQEVPITSFKYDGLSEGSILSYSNADGRDNLFVDCNGCPEGADVARLEKGILQYANGLLFPDSMTFDFTMGEEGVEFGSLDRSSLGRMISSNSGDDIVLTNPFLVSDMSGNVIVDVNLDGMMIRGDSADNFVFPKVISGLDNIESPVIVLDDEASVNFMNAITSVGSVMDQNSDYLAKLKNQVKNNRISIGSDSDSEDADARALAVSIRDGLRENIDEVVDETQQAYDQSIADLRAILPGVTDPATRSMIEDTISSLEQDKGMVGVRVYSQVGDTGGFFDAVKSQFGISIVDDDGNYDLSSLSGLSSNPGGQEIIFQIGTSLVTDGNINDAVKAWNELASDGAYTQTAQAMVASITSSMYSNQANIYKQQASDFNRQVQDLAVPRLMSIFDATTLSGDNVQLVSRSLDFSRKMAQGFDTLSRLSQVQGDDGYYTPDDIKSMGFDEFEQIAKDQLGISNNLRQRYDNMRGAQSSADGQIISLGTSGESTDEALAKLYFERAAEIRSGQGGGSSRQHASMEFYAMAAQIAPDSEYGQRAQQTMDDLAFTAFLDNPRTKAVLSVVSQMAAGTLITFGAAPLATGAIRVLGSASAPTRLLTSARATNMANNIRNSNIAASVADDFARTGTLAREGLQMILEEGTNFIIPGAGDAFGFTGLSLGDLSSGARRVGGDIVTDAARAADNAGDAVSDAVSAANRHIDELSDAAKKKGKNGCFIKGTKITMYDNSEKNIEDIKEGDIVLGFTGEEIVPAKVLSTLHFVGEEFIMINDFIEVTPEHPFFVDGRWKKAKDIVEGDMLFDIGGNEVLVEKVSRQRWLKDIFNLEVDRHHTFYANKILVHNKAAARSASDLEPMVLRPDDSPSPLVMEHLNSLQSSSPDIQANAQSNLEDYIQRAEQVLNDPTEDNIRIFMRQMGNPPDLDPSTALRDLQRDVGYASDSLFRSNIGADPDLASSYLDRAEEAFSNAGLGDNLDSVVNNRQLAFPTSSTPSQPPAFDVPEGQLGDYTDDVLRQSQAHDNPIQYFENQPGYLGHGKFGVGFVTPPDVDPNGASVTKMFFTRNQLENTLDANDRQNIDTFIEFALEEADKVKIANDKGWGPELFHYREMDYENGIPQGGNMMMTRFIDGEGIDSTTTLSYDQLGKLEPFIEHRLYDLADNNYHIQDFLGERNTIIDNSFWDADIDWSRVNAGDSDYIGDITNKYLKNVDVGLLSQGNLQRPDGSQLTPAEVAPTLMDRWKQKVLNTRRQQQRTYSNSVADSTSITSSTQPPSSLDSTTVIPGSDLSVTNVEPSTPAGRLAASGPEGFTPAVVSPETIAHIDVADMDVRRIGLNSDDFVVRDAVRQKLAQYQDSMPDMVSDLDVRVRDSSSNQEVSSLIQQREQLGDDYAASIIMDLESRVNFGEYDSDALEYLVRKTERLTDLGFEDQANDVIVKLRETGLTS